MVNCEDTCTKNAALFLFLFLDIIKRYCPDYAMQQSTNTKKKIALLQQQGRGSKLTTKKRNYLIHGSNNNENKRGSKLNAI